VRHLKRCLTAEAPLPCVFNILLRDWLVGQGWRQCVSDPCIYTFMTCDVFATIAVLVDDIYAACNDTNWLLSFKVSLDRG
jgi:hypothetical protein